MNDLSAPLVPAEVDLRDFAFMPLDVLRLRDSDLSTLATGDEFKAAVMLWCVAWHQLPAGSVPKDERWLARHSGAGPAWKKVRAEALRGFVECSDGRLYHQVVSEKACESWAKKQEQRAKTLKARIAGINKRLTEAVTAEEKQHLQTLLQTLSQSLSQAYSKSVTKPVTGRVTTSKGTEGNSKGQLRDSEVKGEVNLKTSSAADLAREASAETAAPLSKHGNGKPTKAGTWAVELMRLGVGVTSMHPTLLQLIEDGYELPAVIEALQVARQRKPEPEKIPIGYLDPIIRNPPKAAQKSWWASESATLAKGRELGIEARPGEDMEAFRDRIRTRAHA